MTAELPIDAAAQQDASDDGSAPGSAVPPPALQARSKKTQDRIFAAGTQILEAGGLEALTIAAVAADAGVAVGSVYRRFGDKERLIAAIQARFTAEFRTEFAEGILAAGLDEQASASSQISAVVHSVAETFRAHARLLRVFMLAGTGNPTILAEGSAASIEGARIFRDAIISKAADFSQHPDIEAAIDFAHRMTYSVCAHRVIHGEHLESARGLSWEDLTHQLSTALTAYLLSPEPAPARA